MRVHDMYECWFYGVKLEWRRMWQIPIYWLVTKKLSFLAHSDFCCHQIQQDECQTMKKEKVNDWSRMENSIQKDGQHFHPIRPECVILSVKMTLLVICK